MMYRELKSEIHRISKLDDPEKALEEIKKLDHIISKPKIEVRKTGNYAYFYEMEAFYDKEVKEKRTRVIGNLGRIDAEEYESNKVKFKQMSKKE